MTIREGTTKVAQGTLTVLALLMGLYIVLFIGGPWGPPAISCVDVIDGFTVVGHGIECI